jgi:hypothetical protein
MPNHAIEYGSIGELHGYYILKPRFSYTKPVAHLKLVVGRRKRDIAS